MTKIEELKELMIKRSIFLEDIEKSIERKIDTDKPLDIAIVLNYIKNIGK